MNPTQQEIIELAREAGIDKESPYTAVEYREPWNSCTDEELVSLVHLALERFGAGGGEPDAYMAHNTKTGERCPFLADDPDLQHAKSFAHVKTQALYLHPSPTDLRNEYLRGLEDAAKVADANATDARTRHAKFRCVNIAEAIRALKGKQ